MLKVKASRKLIDPRTAAIARSRVSTKGAVALPKSSAFAFGAGSLGWFGSTPG